MAQPARRDVSRWLIALERSDLCEGGRCFSAVRPGRGCTYKTVSGAPVDGHSAREELRHD